MKNKHRIPGLSMHKHTMKCVYYHNLNACLIQTFPTVNNTLVFTLLAMFFVIHYINLCLGENGVTTEGSYIDLQLYRITTNQVTKEQAKVCENRVLTILVDILRIKQNVRKQHIHA